jgi:Leucine-rich repeat (LRR) protein
MSSDLLGLPLPREISAEIMAFHLSATRNLNVREVSPLMRQVTDIAFRTLWRELKAGAWQDGINLTQLIASVETDHPDDSDAFRRFRVLNERVERLYQVGLGSRHCILPSHFAEVQQQILTILDRSLQRIWAKIREQFTAFPNLSSAREIRNFLNDPANATVLNSITSIDLSGLDLHLVPLEICRLTQLQELNLNDNRLTAIPDLSALTQLRVLNLRSNQLTAIPDLSALTQLQWLHLDYNQLSSIPDLSALTQLRVLNLGSNQLTAIPDLSALTQLRELSFRNNQLTAIPDLSALTQLFWLHLSNNQLTAIPGLSALTQLTWLTLSNNQLSSIPDLSALTQLTWLHLNNNRLSSIPDLSALTRLRGLHLSNNQLTAIPRISGLIRLREFSYANNPCESYIQQIARRIGLLLTNVYERIRACFQFFRGLIFRS